MLEYSWWCLARFISQSGIYGCLIKPLNIHPVGRFGTCVSSCLISRCKSTKQRSMDIELTPKVLALMQEKCPDISRVSINELQMRVANLLGHNIARADVRHIMLNHPRTLTVPQIDLNKGVDQLRNTLNIKASELSTVFVKAPDAFIEDIGPLLHRVDYLYTMMGTDDYDVNDFVLVVNSTLHYIKLRHTFLSRRGQYFAPDKDGKTKIVNPSLHEILDVSKERFCSRVAKCSLAEYDLFAAIFQRETEILQQKMDGNEPDVDEHSEVKSDLADILLPHLK